MLIFLKIIFYGEVLTTLCLQKNPIGNDGLTHLALALQNNTVLHHFESILFEFEIILSRH